MKLRITIKPDELARMIPEDSVLAEAAARSLKVVLRRHLREKNRTSTHRAGFPKSNYYANAAENVAEYWHGSTGGVEVEKDGLALHYEGGTIYPKSGHKALAIPIDPSVAGIWPSEYGAFATGGDDGGALSVFWPKGSSHGFIKENETGELLWLLVPSSRIPADKTVLPEESEMLAEAESAIWSVA